jgi:hypothetical protein
MRTRTLTLGLLLGFLSSAWGLGCSSSTSNPPDAGKKNDAGSDATSKDGPSDMASEGGAGGMTADGGDASTDGGLTVAQARGKYLVNVVIGCPDCHTPMNAMGMPDTTKFLAGNPNFVVLPNGDKLGSRNLTNDPTGLKNRSDDEIKNMFLNGKRPVQGGSSDGGAADGGASDGGAADGGAADGGSSDGGAGDGGAAPTGSNAFLNPIMPYYVFHNMAADDADAIVAYLRTVPGVNNEIPRRGPSFDVPAPANYLDPTKIPVPPDTYADKASAMRGRYLASQSGLCIECHTKHLMGGADPLDTTKFFQGGEDFSAFFATTLMIHPISANLTSDNATGLGTWSLMDVKNVLLMGKDKEGNGICPPMPISSYAHLMDTDATDIANYIKSLPAATNMINDTCSFPPSDGGAPPSDGGGADGGSDAGSGDAGGN